MAKRKLPSVRVSKLYKILIWVVKRGNKQIGPYFADRRDAEERAKKIARMDHARSKR